MKPLLKLGKRLTRRELKQVNGGKTKKAVICFRQCITPVEAEECDRLGCICEVEIGRCLL